MPLRHWDYFLALEADFITASRFVEVAEDNYSSFSIEYTHLLLSAGSEIDVVAKLLCRRIENGSAADTIAAYCSTIVDRYPDLPGVQAGLMRADLLITPWADWATRGTPP